MKATSKQTTSEQSGNGRKTGWIHALTRMEVVLPAVTVVVLCTLWELAASLGIIDEEFLPRPSAIAAATVKLMGQSLFWEATGITVFETIAGFVIGVAVAWLLGTFIGLFKAFKLAVYPLTIAFQIMPRVALAPLFLIWFGFGISSKVMMAATICFFPVLISVIVGINNVDRDAATLMKSFGASRSTWFWKLALPSSLPIIFAGIKTAMTLALIGAVVGEFVGASKGMGVLISTFNQQLRIAEGFAVMLVLSLIGLILYAATEVAEKRIVFWSGSKI